MNLKSNKYVIFADGACSGNPGPGGWGAVLYSPKGIIKELGGFSQSTTNNKMELSAAIESLKYLKSVNSEIIFYTDSSYVLNGITKWVWGWLKKDWKSSQGQDVSNKDFWIELLNCIKNKKIDWRYCPGHSGITGNEIADQIAVSFSKTQYYNLYYGSEESYSHTIFPLPELYPIPSMGGTNTNFNKKSNEKPFYLSYSNGVVFLHNDWSSCQSCTQGISGAKYKKLKNQDEVNATLKSWNLDPQKIEVKKR